MKPTLILALLTATALLACHTSCPEGCDIGDTLQKLGKPIRPDASNTIERPKPVAFQTTPLSTAELETAIYRMWLSCVPTEFTYDTTTGEMHFLPMTITDSLRPVLQCMLSTYCNAQADTLKKHQGKPVYPFVGQKNHAFYISKANIEAAIAGTTHDGIRVYLASNPLDFVHANRNTAHLYVVPAAAQEAEGIRTTHDFFPKDTGNGEHYVYDLTWPCPATCDMSPAAISPLNNPRNLYPQQ